MDKTKQTDSKRRARRPALSPEARENQMIALAMDLAEQKLLDGTASSQLITEFVKRGTLKARLENEKLVEENKLLKAKTESITESKNMNKMYQEAIEAMQRYGGHVDE